MKNLIARLKRIEQVKGTVFILYSYPFGSNQEEVDTAREKAKEKFVSEGGNLDAFITLVGIQEFGKKELGESKWFFL
jgi:hypothetical protein